MPLLGRLPLYHRSRLPYGGIVSLQHFDIVPVLALAEVRKGLSRAVLAPEKFPIRQESWLLYPPTLCDTRESGSA
jgi:hypothetical protein